MLRISALKNTVGESQMAVAKRCEGRCACGRAWSTVDLGDKASAVPSNSAHHPAGAGYATPHFVSSDVSPRCCASLLGLNKLYLYLFRMQILQHLWFALKSGSFHLLRRCLSMPRIPRLLRILCRLPPCYDPCALPYGIFSSPAPSPPLAAENLFLRNSSPLPGALNQATACHQCHTPHPSLASDTGSIGVRPWLRCNLRHLPVGIARAFSCSGSGNPIPDACRFL